LNGQARVLIYLLDVPPGQNNQIALFEQHITQDFASFVLATK
jgi:hypothetical protein